MSGTKFTPEQYAAVLSRPGYGVSGGVKGGIGKAGITSKVSDSRTLHNLESDTCAQQMGAEKLQVNYSGKPEIRITFYRRRLADHSRAISEKALVDCFQYAGLIEGDSQEEVRITYVEQEKIGTDQEERTEVHIIYPEVDLDNLWIPAKQHKGR